MSWSGGRQEGASSSSLQKLNLQELKEFLRRQSMLAANKKFLMSLPDKGAKVIRTKERLEQEVREKEASEEAAQLLSQLTVQDVQRLEWKDVSLGEQVAEKEGEQEEDDEETKVLRVLATQGATGKAYFLDGKKASWKQLQAKSQERLGKAACIVKKAQDEEKKREPFKPSLSLRHSPGSSPRPEEGKEEAKKSGSNTTPKWWEVTAATFPLLLNPPLKELSLGNSLQLQAEHESRMQVLHGGGALAAAISSPAEEDSVTDPEKEQDEEEEEEEEHEGVVFAYSVAD